MKNNANVSTPAGNSLKNLTAPLFLLLLTVFAVSRVTPPPAGTASAPATEFSSHRAMTKLQVIARKLHPMGVPAHGEVREYLLGELSALGVAPEVQTATIVSERRRPARAATVQNIVARLAGTAGGKSLLLASHYDSAPTSYGASDDGSTVATMLETLRALKLGAPLRNDVIFLFTDGEEAGLLGAEAFVRRHPLAKNVGLVLNMEARGHKGPSIMFETSQQNGRLISEFAQAAPNPVATSLAYEVYRRLPNDTDLSVFKDAGMPGLNFAFIEGATHYHTALDSYENIDERSLQHQGSYALALTRHFGNLDLANMKAGNSVYFDLFGLKLIHYPGALSILFSVLTAALFIGIVIIGFRRGALKFGRIVLAFFAFLLCIAISAVLIFLLWRLVTLLHGDYHAIPQGFAYNDGYYIISFVTLTVAVTAGLFIWFRKKMGHANVAIGTLSWWLILMILTTLFLPGLSYLFTWPLLFCLLGVGYDFYTRRENAVSLRRLVALILTVVPAIILFVPVVYLMAVALPLALSAAIMVLVALTVGLLLAGLNELAGLNRALLPLAALALALVFVSIGSLTAASDKQHPRFDSLFYGLNADTGKAVWASLDGRTNSWTAQFLSGHNERNTLPDFLPLFTARFLQNEAPVASLNAPEAVLLADNTDGGARTLRLRVTSPRQAAVIAIYVEGSAQIRRASINGQKITVQAPSPLAGAINLWSIYYYAPPQSGLELTLEVKSQSPVKLRIVDQSYGLPTTATASLKPRPENLLPMPYPFNDSTFVTKAFTF